MAAEHALDTITPSITALVVFYDLLVRLPARNADLYSLVFQHFSQPVSVMSPVHQQPLDRSPGCAATGTVAELSGRHMEPHLAAFRINDVMQSPVQATFRPTDPSTERPFFFERKLQPVRCAFRELASMMIVFGPPGGKADHDPGEARFSLQRRRLTHERSRTTARVGPGYYLNWSGFANDLQTRAAFT